MESPMMKAAAALIILGTLLLLIYGFMTLFANGGPGFMQWGGAAAVVIGLILLYVGKDK